MNNATNIEIPEGYRQLLPGEVITKNDNLVRLGKQHYSSYNDILNWCTPTTSCGMVLGGAEFNKSCGKMSLIYIRKIEKQPKNNKNMKNIVFKHDGITYSLTEASLKYLVKAEYIEREKTYKKIAEFVYLNSKTGENEWRKIGVMEDNSTYVEGLDLNDNNSFKKFLKSRIVGGSKKIFYTKV